MKLNKKIKLHLDLSNVCSIINIRRQISYVEINYLDNLSFTVAYKG